RCQGLPKTPYQTAPKIQAATPAARMAIMGLCICSSPLLGKASTGSGRQKRRLRGKPPSAKSLAFPHICRQSRPRRIRKMAQVQELKVEARGATGKGPAFQARNKGLIPAVVYGGTEDTQNVAVDARTLERRIEAGHFLTTLLMLDVGGKKTRVIPREVQLDPVSDRPVHVDFMRLTEGATVRLEIPVHFNGGDVSPGLKKGGVLNI